MATEKGRAYYENKGYILWDVQTEEKVIALTFDDGPHATYTAEILDLLSAHDAKATFFVLGERAEKFPNLILRQKNEGHEVANHTYSHPYSSTPENLEMELKKTNEIIFEITGTYPLLYRPVGGSYNEPTINTAVKNGYKVVLWSWHQDTEDWKRPGVNKIVEKVLSGAKPGDVVLFHDAGGNRSQTVKALEEILPELKKEGYEFVTVSELLNRNSIEVSRKKNKDNQNVEK
ncbi:polysaccharide deacetylase family protein [Sporosarcina sp. G11-34]|nr:polysaccharide deacetylase family protein [Sporosarcina sp. G11-34]MCZ2258097.1 polysaccharide deacetylase family protein [Sporosarcina sp. G11-34]